MTGVAGTLPECDVKTLTTPPSGCVAVGRAEPKLFGLPGKTLDQDAVRRLQFDVNWLAALCDAPHILALC